LVIRHRISEMYNPRIETSQFGDPTDVNENTLGRFLLVRLIIYPPPPRISKRLVLSSEGNLIIFKATRPYAFCSSVLEFVLEGGFDTFTALAMER
jgi:hypothetical protein